MNKKYKKYKKHKKHKKHNKHKKYKKYFYIIIGYFIKFVHYILSTFIITYVLFFSNNFILNIFILGLLIITVYSWYLINCCIIILDEEKYDMNKRLLVNNSKIKIFDTDIIIFDYVKNSSQTYLILVYIILYLFKIIYLYNKKFFVK
jgi:hypothetical protein